MSGTQGGDTGQQANKSSRLVVLLAGEIRRLRNEAGLSQPQLAQRTGYTRQYISLAERPQRNLPSSDLVRALDAALGAQGALIELRESAKREQRSRRERLIGSTVNSTNDAIPPVEAGSTTHGGEQSRRSFLVASGVAAIDASLPPSSSTVLQALEIVTSRDADTLEVATDCLDELVRHYSEKLPVAPPVEVYDDLLKVRSFADSLLNRSNSSARRRTDLVAATGWLSNLLAVATSYMGDHASSLIWCLDAERHSHDSGNREIAAWAAFNKAMMAYYQGRTNRSVELARSGRTLASVGTVAYAKLAAHEMRACAMIGDAERMLEARGRATAAIAELPPSVTTSGVFSIAVSEDPPYTATSLLLLDRFEEAAAATEGVIKAAYRTDAGNRNRQSSNYSRTLLILGLAKAGIGDIEAAVAAGREALGGGVVWPTLVLARKLDQALMRTHESVPEVMEYHELCRSLASSVTGRVN
ncbi:helix-turn-helix domain-containing protein [Actinosynnema sp. CA-248983]